MSKNKNKKGKQQASSSDDLSLGVDLLAQLRESTQGFADLSPLFTRGNVIGSEGGQGGQGAVVQISAEDFNAMVDEAWQTTEDTGAKKGKKSKKKKKKKGEGSSLTLEAVQESPETQLEAPVLPTTTELELESLSLATSKPRAPIMHFCCKPSSVEEHVLFPVYQEPPTPYERYILVVDKEEKFLVDGHSRRDKLILEPRKYDFSLTDWLMTNGVESRWDPLYDSWNSFERKRLNKVDGVSSWDSQRVSENTRMIIEGILKAIMEDLHSQGDFHGFLYNSDNFLFREKVEYRAGTRVGKFECFWVLHNLNNAEKEDNKSIEKDMMRICGIIFDTILEGRELPREWKHLQRLMTDHANLDMNRRLISDHPCLWPWKQRFTFYELVWMLLQHGKDEFMQDVGIENSDEPQSIFDCVTSVLGNYKGWHSLIPIDTPLSRIQDGRFLQEDGYAVLSFLRVVHFHYKDMHRKDDGTNTYYLLESDNEDYKHDQFIELVTSECFPLFLVRVYSGLCRIGLSI